MLFCRFRRKKSGNDWILASAKAMDIEVDEDLYLFLQKGLLQRLTKYIHVDKVVVD